MEQVRQIEGLNGWGVVSVYRGVGQDLVDEMAKLVGIDVGQFVQIEVHFLSVL